MRRLFHAVLGHARAASGDAQEDLPDGGGGFLRCLSDADGDEARSDSEVSQAKSESESACVFEQRWVQRPPVSESEGVRVESELGCVKYRSNSQLNRWSFAYQCLGVINHCSTRKKTIVLGFHPAQQHPPCEGGRRPR